MLLSSRKKSHQSSIPTHASTQACMYTSPAPALQQKALTRERQRPDGLERHLKGRARHCTRKYNFLRTASGATCLDEGKLVLFFPRTQRLHVCNRFGHHGCPRADFERPWWVRKINDDTFILSHHLVFVTPCNGQNRRVRARRQGI